MEEIKDKERILEWDYSIPLYSRSVVIGCLYAFGIPTVIISVIIFWSMHSITSRGGTVSLDGLPYALVFVGLIIFFTMFLLWLIYRNRFESHFTINDKGLTVSSAGKTRKKNRTMNSLLFFLGLISGKPGAMGTSMIVNSMQDSFVAWEDIFKFKVYPKTKSISLKNNWREIMVVYCTKENYEEALAWITEEVAKRKYARAKDLKSIRKEHIFSLLLTPFVLLFGFFLSAVYEYDFDSKIFMFLTAGYVLLVSWVPSWIKKFLAIGGFILTIIYWVWGISVITEGYFSHDDWIRVIFSSLGAIGLLVILFLNYRKKEQVK